MKTTRVIIFFIFFFYTSVSFSTDLVKKKAKQKTAQEIEKLSEKLSSQTLDFIVNFTEETFKNIKYFDLDIQAREHLKPTISLMSVTEILPIDSGTIFNQMSLNTHDSDETINLGLGIRKLLDDDKILVGSNIFYDHQFTEDHKRSGAGAEVISSIFDFRGNYYNAISKKRVLNDGSSERALDGWDTQLDYHFHGKFDLNIFINAFKFENPDKESEYKEKGNKYGANATLGHFILEAGYLDDNKDNDSYFGSIKYVVKFGEEQVNKKPVQWGFNPKVSQLTDVSDKLYQPVKRENKIRVVKISAAGVVASGF